MTDLLLTILAVSSLCGWIYLLCLRGGFWRADQWLDAGLRVPGTPPEVVAIIPARNEAASIGKAVASLLNQSYRGLVSVVVVDDGSNDDTAKRAIEAGGTGGATGRVSVINGRPLSPGWTGKLWAVQQGVAWCARNRPNLRYLLITDADIVHESHNLSRLVAKAERDHRDLVSLMVHLNCETGWERLLIPAFIFFFQKLYPFSWVNNANSPVAAAAGGCMLVRASALNDAGGIEAIRHHLIDDCALAARIKRQGAIWLGLTRESRSLRRYESLGELWSMVARTAYTQLGYSVANLVATVLGMTTLYLVPPVAVVYGVLAGHPLALAAGGMAWATMAWMLGPTLSLYRLSAWRGALLPVMALLFTLMTIDSARSDW
ncbi:MAG: glycosyltransferase, partial [Rhodospirillales bacterium]|nr:glycosyltransferase [Rhodospirillales bacterium]